MRESDIEGLAIHGGPEPCVVVREGGGEASVGVRAGRAIEPRNLLVRGADVVLQGGRQHRRWRYSRAVGGPRGVEEPVHARNLRTREPGGPTIIRPLVMGGRVARGRPRP
jgi:hypothetical protein